MTMTIDQITKILRENGVPAAEIVAIDQALHWTRDNRERFGTEMGTYWAENLPTVA